MNYTVVIRTLGMAGEKYQALLNSLAAQTIQPAAILVYIAEGYPLPKETIGVERYIYVKKGMVAQRALRYDEVETEYMLFLDDDVYLPLTAVETLYTELQQYNGDVIAPILFYNHLALPSSKLKLFVSGKEVCRFKKDDKGFKVLRTTGFSYPNNPSRPVVESQTNAGPCLFCAKKDFLTVCLPEELWLDETFYALPEDQVLFYKMHKRGLKVLTSYDSGIVHLDASTTQSGNQNKLPKLIFSEYRNKVIFWHRFIYLPEDSVLLKIWSIVCLLYVLLFQSLKMLIKVLCGQKEIARSWYNGLKSAISFLLSDEYKTLPRI